MFIPARIFCKLWKGGKKQSWKATISANKAFKHSNLAVFCAVLRKCNFLHNYIWSRSWGGDRDKRTVSFVVKLLPSFVFVFSLERHVHFWQKRSSRDPWILSRFLSGNLIANCIGFSPVKFWKITRLKWFLMWVFFLLGRGEGDLLLCFGCCGVDRNVSFSQLHGWTVRDKK